MQLLYHLQYLHKKTFFFPDNIGNTLKLHCKFIIIMLFQVAMLLEKSKEPDKTEKFRNWPNMLKNFNILHKIWKSQISLYIL